MLSTSAATDHGRRTVIATSGRPDEFGAMDAPVMAPDPDLSSRRRIT